MVAEILGDLLVRVGPRSMRLHDGAFSIKRGILGVCQRGHSRASVWREGWHHCATKLDLTLRMCAVYDHGLQFKASAIKKLKKNANGVLHDSFKGIWKAFGTKTRSISRTALVHQSVEKRMNKGYAPKNLPENPTFVKR